MGLELDKDRVNELARRAIEDMLQDLRLEAEVVDGQISISLSLHLSRARWLSGGRMELCSTTITLPLPKPE